MADASIRCGKRLIACQNADGQALALWPCMIKCLSTLIFLVASSSAFAEPTTFKIDRQELYPAIELYNEWLAFSPDKLPADDEYLKRMDGAILLEKPQAEYVVEHFESLTLVDLAADFSTTKDTQKIPYRFSLEWKSHDGLPGALHVIGHLEIVDGLFNLNLNKPKEFRDRFAAHVLIDSLTGDETAEAIKVVNEVIPQFIAGKLVSFARLGFNAIEQQLKDKLQEQLEKIPRRKAL